MTRNLIRLRTIGFTRAGRWLFEKEMLTFELNTMLASEDRVLYAFVVNGVLMYVGKTTTTLRKRMQSYKTPSKNAERGGSTNIKNNRNIVKALVSGDSVEIFVLLDPGSQTHGEFVVNLAAGLEDSLIDELSPPWNGVRLQEESNPIIANPTKPLTTTRTEQVTPATGDARFRKIDFQRVLQQMLREGADSGVRYIDVKAGELHRHVGYPANGHVMPTCCGVMRAEMIASDEVLSEPPKGKGSSLSIRYRFPRA